MIYLALDFYSVKKSQNIEPFKLSIFLWFYIVLFFKWRSKQSRNEHDHRALLMGI